MNQRIDPRIQALQHIYDQWHQYPGRMPNGSGPTGLQSNDSKGWSNMLNEQTEALRLGAELQGKPGPNIEYGGSMGYANPPSAMRSTFNPSHQSSAVSTAAPMVDKRGNFEGYDVQERKPQNSGRFNPMFQSSAIQGLLNFRGRK